MPPSPRRNVDPSPSRTSDLRTAPHDTRDAYELKPLSPSPSHNSHHDFEEDQDETSHFVPSEHDDDDDDDVDADTSSVQSYELYTPLESTRVLHKLDRRLVSFMALLYMLSFLDRSNIGNARIAGLADDLRLSSAQYEWLLWAFYITYIAFEWMTLLYKVVPPHIYIALCIASWGVIASVQAAASSFGFLLVLRALLGVSEAAFGPGVPFYLSSFFRREELALRTGLFISASPLSASFAGALAWVITKLGEKGPLSPWRMLFLIEGFPSVLVAVWAWDFVPDGPGVAKWLTERERKVAVLRLRQEKEEEENEREEKSGYATHTRRGIDLGEVWKTLKDPKCYLTAVSAPLISPPCPNPTLTLPSQFMFFSCNVAFASMPVFLPTLIHDMGHTALTAQALSAPPYLVAFAVVLLTAYLSDRYRSRSTFIIFHSLLATTGYATLALCGHFRYEGTALRYLALYPAAAGFFSAITIIITWNINNQESETGKGAGVAIMNVIGQMGPLVGTSVFPKEDGPWYVRGMSICAGFMLLVGVLAGMLRWYLGRENRRRKGGGGEGGEYEGVGTGQRRQIFEYML